MGELEATIKSEILRSLRLWKWLVNTYRKRLRSAVQYSKWMTGTYLLKLDKIEADKKFLLILLVFMFVDAQLI